MTEADVQRISLSEGRFAHVGAIEWWRQSVLRDARILVVGAGALGNEVIKNLSLLGAGHIIVVDMDRVEPRNLSRSILFRADDQDKPKVECAARMAREIYPDLQIVPVMGTIQRSLGYGFFRWADVVIGAVDNREARVFINSACARVDRPWIDGGIDILQGIVRGFHPPKTACYECTMSDVDWQILNRRRSCSLLAQRAISEQGAPTTPTVASIIGAMQVQEVVKHLHGMASLLGAGYVFEGTHHTSYKLNYPISPDCPWHEPAAAIKPIPGIGSETAFSAIWEIAKDLLGEVHVLELAREIVESATCAACGFSRLICKYVESVSEQDVRCGNCGGECSLSFTHEIREGSQLLRKSALELGLPPWEIIWARNGRHYLGLELTKDKPHWATEGGKAGETS